MTRMSSKMGAAMALWQLLEMINASIEDDSVVLRKYSEMRLPISRMSYHRNLKKFEQHGLIKKKKLDSGHAFIITNKAKWLRRRVATKISRNDGFSTLIIFDIPEAKHGARDTFRRFLLRNGYTTIRDSTFVSPYKLSAEIKDLIKELQIERNISILSAKIEQL